MLLKKPGADALGFFMFVCSSPRMLDFRVLILYVDPQFIRSGELSRSAIHR
jgi:hypothetical protein